MPYEQRTGAASRAPNHDALVSQLVAEFLPSLASGLTEAALGLKYKRPNIIEGQIRNTDRLEVYVVWEGWVGVSEEHRTNAILDAYREGQPKKIDRIVIALGVTPEEAKNLGIIS